MYILINYWIATSTSGSYCLNKSSNVYSLYTTCSKCLPPAHTKISDVNKLKRCIKQEWTVWITLFIEHAVGDVEPASTFAFLLEADISSIWCKDDVTYYMFDDFPDNDWLFNNSSKCTRKYCVDSLIYHFKFPKVVLAYVSGKVGTFCIVMLSVSSRTCLPIFIEIGSYLTNIEHKIRRHVFWDMVYNDLRSVS